ncbi:MAG: sugar phosphate isomerase/epimerase [Clostridia bacterium]|nr:sugar phosphate isomerase/epimerase [Clostridia bacterium]
MRLGAQFFSIRNHTTTPEGVIDAFREMKRIGYQTVQLSGICKTDAEVLKEISAETALPIVTTHIAPQRVLEETDAVIAEHKIFGCPEIGIGMMPDEYRGSVEGVRKFIKDFTPALEKIRAAGLRLAYHNHAFEFDDLGGTNAYELLINEMPGLYFIIDVYWLHYAGQDIEKMLERLKDRTVSVHFKDMLTEPQGAICPCGDGVIDFAFILAVCDRLGIPEALVEQDNAPETESSYACMKKSFDALAPLFGLK